MNKLIRYFDPFGSVPSLIPSDFMKEFESLFGSLDMYNMPDRTWRLTKGFPQVGIVEKENEAIIELALAGYSKNQLSVRVEDSMVVVTATRRSEDENGRCHTMAQRAFSKSIVVNNKVFDLDRTQVSFEDGLLQIKVPRFKQEQPLSKELEIK
jgi:HSP20 family protein